MDNYISPKNKKKRIIVVLWRFIRDFISISLAFAFANYITEYYNISSTISKILIYFGFLIVTTILIYFVIKLIKKQRQ